MKYINYLVMLTLIFTLLTGCGSSETAATQDDTIVATTYPMYYMTQRLLEGVEGVQVEVLVQEPVSCVHDYTLTTTQMKMLEQAELIVMNGSGLEHFMESALESIPEKKIVDTGKNLQSEDPHTWLATGSYIFQSCELAEVLKKQYPEYYEQLTYNYETLQKELNDLHLELEETLSGISCNEMITFHDGFGLFAESFGLTIAAAIEEEEGSTASAQQIEEICTLIREHNIPAIFVEKNGSTNAAEIIAAETGVKIYTLNTMMDGETDYFTAMRENIQSVKEALS